MILNIGSEQIQSSVRRNSHYCAISTSLGVALPDADRIVVTMREIRYTLHGVRFALKTPQAARSYLYKFDRGDDLEPFVLDLDIEHARILPKRNPAARRKQKTHTVKHPYTVSARKYGGKFLPELKVQP